MEGRHLLPMPNVVSFYYQILLHILLRSLHQSHEQFWLESWILEGHLHPELPVIQTRIKTLWEKHIVIILMMKQNVSRYRSSIIFTIYLNMIFTNCRRHIINRYQGKSNILQTKKQYSKHDQVKDRMLSNISCPWSLPWI